MSKRVVWLLVPLVLFLVIRISRRSRLRRPEQEVVKDIEKIKVQGKDSDFYLVEKRLAEMGYSRYPYETMSDWVRRIGRASTHVDTALLHPLIRSHYRYRFDPLGMKEDERTHFTSKVNQWLSQHEESKGH
jgi:hypothetical protein